MSRELPILYSHPMVRAIRNDQKTQTRRVIMPQPTRDANGMWHWRDCQWMDGGLGFPASGIADHARYKPGDILWVREAWRLVDYQYIDGIWSASVQFRADMAVGPRLFWAEGAANTYERIGWRPSIHMPRKAARLFLRVTAVRAERVQDITEADAMAEGAMPEPPFSFVKPYRRGFARLWDSINAKRGFGWEDNPFCWVYEFEEVKHAKG